MEFDYVIVGGGSAGSTLAARLSADEAVTVCLIEAGGEGKGILVRMPMGVVAMLPGRPRINNWAFQTIPQPGLGGRKGYQPRGKALGGSSAINAMLYVRGHPGDYDEWASNGAAGWGWSDVLPYFKLSEGNSRGNEPLHGNKGPLQVGEQQSPRPISRSFVDACEQSQIRRNEDFNGAIQEGAGLYQVTQFRDGERRGERCSAAAAYLHPAMSRPNLQVITSAHATGIELTGKRATSVSYRHGGVVKSVRARREILLAGGAFNSPQLLMLSGIGPAANLVGHGIEVRHDLPGVGRNLQDHVDFTTLWKSLDTDMLGIGLTGTLNIFKALLEWRRTGTGFAATPGAEGGAFIRSHPDLSKPDLQLHFVPGLVDDHVRKLHLGYGYSCHVCVLRPFSRGDVQLESADPLASPRIDPNFFSDERDMASLVAGTRITQRILAAPAFAKYRHKQLYLNGNESDAELVSHIRARADTIYHPVGTCRMGRDELAVVDPALRVRGIDGLRVIDASVMPTLIGGNTNAATIMIAEKAAHMIRTGA